MTSMVRGCAGEPQGVGYGVVIKLPGLTVHKMRREIRYAPYAYGCYLPNTRGRVEVNFLGAGKLFTVQKATIVDERQSKAPWQNVIIRGVDIPFLDLVFLLVKLTIAAIPAGIIVTLFAVVAVGIISGIVGS